MQANRGQLLFTANTKIKYYSVYGMVVSVRYCMRILETHFQENSQTCWT